MSDILIVLTRGQHCLVKFLSMLLWRPHSMSLSVYLNLSVFPSDPRGPLNHTEYPAVPCNPHNRLTCRAMTDENTHTSINTYTTFEVPAFLRVNFPTAELKQYVLETLPPSAAAHCLNCVPVAGLHVFSSLLTWKDVEQH